MLVTDDDALTFITPQWKFPVVRLGFLAELRAVQREVDEPQPRLLGTLRASRCDVHFQAGNSSLSCTKRTFHMENIVTRSVSRYDDVLLVSATTRVSVIT